MTQEETIALYRPPLYSLALKMVKSAQDAEDIIQETFLKWLTIDQSKIENTKAYLTQTVINKCLNHLKWLNQRKNECIENFKNIDFTHFDLFDNIDLSKFDLSHELSAAMATIHHKLKPLEKTVFLLREVFDFEYDELQEVLDERKDYCRQLLHRAKEKLNKEKASFSLDIQMPKDLLEKFKNACTFGNMSGLIDHLTNPKENN